MENKKQNRAKLISGFTGVSVLLALCNPVFKEGNISLNAGYIGTGGMTVGLLVGLLIGGIFAVAMPAIAQPYVRKITGNDDIALGHFCTVGYVLTAWVGKLTGGKKSVSTEELQLPKGLEFLQDTYLSIGIVMIPLFLVTAFFAGPEFCAEFAGATNYLVHAFLQAVQFVVGVYVLLAGVRLLLAEIVPAFRGIAMKLVPDAKPALDCPVLSHMHLTQLLSAL